MPIYEFKCEECSHVFTELKKIGDFNGGVCPSCGSEKTAKKMSSFSSSVTVSVKGCSTSGGG